MRRASPGLTLLEMLAVLAIMGILTAVTTPNFIVWLHQYRLQAATASFTNHLRAARLLAIFKGVTHQVQLKKFNEGNYYQVVEDPKGKDKIVLSIGRIVLDKDFGEVLLTCLPADGLISFTPQGTSKNATICLKNSVGAQVNVIINNFGRVRTEYL